MEYDVNLQCYGSTATTILSHVFLYWQKMIWQTMYWHLEKKWDKKNPIAIGKQNLYLQMAAFVTGIFASIEK